MSAPATSRAPASLAVAAALLVALVAARVEAQTTDPSVSEAPATVSTEAAFKRWFVHLNLGFNVFTYNAATNSSPAQQFTPAQRIGLGQQVGGGYFVHPNVRLQLTLQFAETVRGLPPGTSPFALFAVLPLAVFTAKGAFIGVGPMLAPRAFSQDVFELGAFLTAGYSFKLPEGFGLGLAVQVPITFLHRVSVQLTPLLSLSYRF